jgi:membrane protease YdiL (CAAX protease family)
VLLCSDFPTQLVLGATFAAFGFSPLNGNLSLTYVALLALSDSVLLIGLITVLVHARGERMRHLLLGRRPLLAEMRAGVPLIFVAFAIAIAVLLTLQAVAPWLRTVPHNPLQDLVSTPRDAVLFGLVLVVAGGLREEVQRAFLLNRFERWLGGPAVGLVMTSAAFGLGHFLQGADAAVATAVLGAFWGSVYLRRRSIGSTLVSHAGFNLVQVLQFLLLTRQ